MWSRREREEGGRERMKGGGRGGGENAAVIVRLFLWINAHIHRQFYHTWDPHRNNK